MNQRFSLNSNIDTPRYEKRRDSKIVLSFYCTCSHNSVKKKFNDWRFQFKLRKDLIFWNFCLVTLTMKICISLYYFISHENWQFFSIIYSTLEIPKFLPLLTMDSQIPVNFRMLFCRLILFVTMTMGNIATVK